MSSCGVCVKSISSKHVKLSCSDCEKEFHGACLKMSKADVECITVDGMVWRCRPCSETRRKSLKFESDAEQGKLTLDDLMKKISEIVDNQKKQENNFNRSYETINEKLEENIKAVKDQNSALEKSLSIINQLMEENKKLHKKVSELEKRCDDMEQYSRANAVEIHGIPMKPNEDVMNIVEDVGRALDVKITPSMIDACHRLGKVTGPSSSPPGIIVKFVRRFDKEELMRKRRVKRDFSTRHLDLAMDQPIYINEALTAARRRLFAAARQVKRGKHYKYLWLRGGNIFLRKEESAPALIVTCQADLDNL